MLAGFAALLFVSPLLGADLSTVLQVGAQDPGGTPLTYTWSAQEIPPGAGTPVFIRTAVSGGMVTDQVTVNLPAAQEGIYRFVVTISNGDAAVQEPVTVSVARSVDGTPSVAKPAAADSAGGGCGQASGLAFLGGAVGLALIRRKT